MKKANKKGFTIVELVIVIAVIAILAAVLIPTFSNVVEKANESSAMQEARSAYENWLVDEVEKDGFDMNKVDLCITCGNYCFHVTDGQFSATATAKKDHTTESGSVAGTVTKGVLSATVDYTI